MEGHSNIERAARALAEIGLQGVLCLEEHDPQYHAVAHVSQSLGPGPAALLGALNALVSYRLAMRGEDWWWCWARSVAQTGARSIEEAVRAEKEFLLTCRGSIVGRDAKLRRLDRALRAKRELGLLLEEPTRILQSGAWLVQALSTALGAKPWSKTIVFAAKIAYYAARTAAGPRPAPWDVDIPVDVRVACFLYSTGIVGARSYRDLVRRPRPAQEAVRLLAERSMIPPLNLDTVFWRLGWIPRDLPRSEWPGAVEKVLGGCAEPGPVAGLFREPCRP